MSRQVYGCRSAAETWLVSCGQQCRCGSGEDDLGFYAASSTKGLGRDLERDTWREPG